VKGTKRLWITLVLVVTGAFFILGFFGREIYRQAPPLPEKVITSSGKLLMTKKQILDGQQAWQSVGGQQIGSIWGHGAYQAPDWSADCLHREATALLDVWSQSRHGLSFDKLDLVKQDALKSELVRHMRHNSYDPKTGVLVIDDSRAKAMALTADHYKKLFGGDPSLDKLREDYALHDDAITDPTRLENLSQFFFWTAWSCTTLRPGENFTYSNNWPHEPLVGNRPTTANLMWSIISILLLLAALGVLVWVRAYRGEEPELPVAPAENPLNGFALTPSMKAVGYYLGIIIALFVVQVLLGGLLAHYTVEGDAFYGIPISRWLPYAIARTWHIQTALFWIASSFLAAGLFLAPVIGGAEPKHQRLGVLVLLGALLLVVTGSLTGEWLSVKQHLGLDIGFWFGHQGYEYVDLGRVWQIALYGGLMLWLVLMIRALAPALKRANETRPLVTMFAASAIAIGLLYGSGLFYGARTHLAVAEYWRWWVVHLWVEGFFEVFATATMAFLFTSLGLIHAATATRALLASTAIFLAAGIPGTFHHLYFTGTPVSVTAIGATFSALEVVPLVLIGFEAAKTARMVDRAPWMDELRWPIQFFVGVAFWNLVGAGLFGFLINPPAALYYMQGLNTTAVHGHTALFGVYGLLSLGLVLLIARRLTTGRWKTGPLAYSFWAMNGGLALMVLLSLLPIGLAQTWASMEQGLWYARSAEFLQSPRLETLRWLRVIGDTVFLSGVGALAWFMAGLYFGWSIEPEAIPAESVAPKELVGA